MIITQEDLRVIDKFNNPFSMDQLSEGFRIFEEIINNLDDVGTRELLGGYEKDIDEVCDSDSDVQYASPT